MPFHIRAKYFMIMCTLLLNPSTSIRTWQQQDGRGFSRRQNNGDSLGYLQYSHQGIRTFSRTDTTGFHFPFARIREKGAGPLLVVSASSLFLPGPMSNAGSCAVISNALVRDEWAWTPVSCAVHNLPFFWQFYIASDRPVYRIQRREGAKAQFSTTGGGPRSPNLKISPKS